MFEPDLADRVDDLICTFEGGNPDKEMDTISMLLTGWIIFLFSSIALVKFIYIKYVKKGKKEKLPTSKSIDECDESNNSITVSATNVGNPNSSNGKILISTRSIEPVLQPAKVTSAGQEISSQPSLVDSTIVSGTCSGPDSSVVDYIKQCYSWIYSTNSLEKNASNWDNVKESLIDTLGKILREQGKKDLPIFISIVDINLTSPLQISNLYAECEHANNIKITCDCEATKLQGVLSLYSTEHGSSSCEFYVDRICGRLGILLDCEEQVAIVKFDGWPEICVGIKTSSIDSKLDSKTSEFLAENLASAIRSAVLEVEFKKFTTFPTPPSHVSPKSNARTKRKHLLIKVLRGTDLGKNKGCEEPYCIVELDDPPQRFQSEHMKGTSNPQWNENFVFKVSPNAGEILFEVYDYVGTRFLGCNIVSVDEIIKDTDELRTHEIPLKSRRMEMTEQITGTLEVQFAFLTENELLQRSKFEYFKGSGKSENALWNGHLKDTDVPLGKNVLVIKANGSSSFKVSRPIVKITRLCDGSIVEINEDDDSKQNVAESKEQATLDTTYGEERGRRRTRRGDIFTSIRRRFSKGRSASMLPPTTGSAIDGANSDSGRSLSADRPSLVNNGLGLSSTRSSASELSGLSGQSTTTFIHENSTLVIECNENHVKKYYLVPPHLAESGKWKKRGKKLHIFNDHSFVAKRLASGAPCSVCFGRFQFSLGKQGYQCRDCKLICHKQCHVRVPSFCGKTTVYDIELAAVKPLHPAPLTACKTSSSHDKSISEYISSKKKGVPADISKANSLPLDKRLVAEKNTNKTKTLPSTNIHPTNGTQTKLKTSRKLNIFRRVTRLGKISEEVPINNVSPPESPNTEQQSNIQESTVTILIKNEEEEDFPEQETTAVLQSKCKTVISSKNMKEYSVE